MSGSSFAGQPFGRRRFLALSAAAAVAPFVRLPASMAPEPVAHAAAEPTRIVLPNGLTVLIEERRSANTVAMQLTARAGSRDDGDLPGISIMTSRMMFQGTGEYPSETDLQRAAQLVGGTISRGTTAEWSLFTSVVPSREAEVAFELLSAVVLDPLFDAGALERQKLVTLQDIAERRSNPSSYIDELFSEALFANHPLGRSVIGTEAGIAAVTRADLLAARDRQWVASNLVLTIVGRIGVEEAWDAADAFFGALPTGAPIQRIPAQVTPLAASRTVTGEAGQQQVQFRVGYPAPGLRDPDRYAMILLTALMSGSGGRLFRELRAARGLAYFAGAAYRDFSDAGGWFATAGVDPENVSQAVDITREEIRKMGEAPPSLGEVIGTVSQIAGRQVLADETNAARASRVASREVLGSESTEEFVERMRALTPDDVQRVAQTYLDPDRALIVIVGPARREP